jgi:hypothetical protein
VWYKRCVSRGLADPGAPGSASPARGYRARLAPWRSRAVALLLMLPAGWLAVLFWRVDFVDPLTVSALVLDRTLEAATVFVLPPAALLTLLAPWTLARLGAAAGGAVSVLLGSSAALAALRPPFDLWPTLLAAVSLFAGVALLVWVLHRTVRPKRLTVSLLAPLALLPGLQFWHATSFVPSRLTASVSVEPRVVVLGLERGAAFQDADGESLRGVIEVAVRNNGDVGALVLASRVMTCFRSPYDPKDSDCVDSVILDELSQIGAKSTLIHHLGFRQPATRPLVRLDATVWYARTDRLRVARKKSAHDRHCGPVTTYDLQDEARFKGVVQRDRRLVYAGDQSQAGYKAIYLTTAGEPPCEQSRYRIDDYVGAAYVRVHREDWLRAARQQR